MRLPADPQRAPRSGCRTRPVGAGDGTAPPGVILERGGNPRWAGSGRVPWLSLETIAPPIACSNAKDTPFRLFDRFGRPRSTHRFPIGFAGPYDPSEFEVPGPGPEGDWQIPVIFRDLTLEQKQGIMASYHTAAARMDSWAPSAGPGRRTTPPWLIRAAKGRRPGRFANHGDWEPAARPPPVMRFPGQGRAGPAADGLAEWTGIVQAAAAFPSISME